MTWALCIFGVWLAWVLVHLAAMLLARPNTPCFNGFKIHVPEWVKERLTHEEYWAVVEHERGHRHRRHVWKNFLLVCLLLRASRKKRIAQELEADDYAAAYGPGAARSLASALRKLSADPFDEARAKRLEEIAKRQTEGPRNAGGPNAQGY